MDARQDIADDDVEIVSTSDADEREELAAAVADYWEFHEPAWDASSPARAPSSPARATPDPLDLLASDFDMGDGKPARDAPRSSVPSSTPSRRVEDDAAAMQHDALVDSRASGINMADGQPARKPPTTPIRRVQDDAAPMRVDNQALSDADDDMDDEPIGYGQQEVYYSPLQFPESSPEPEAEQDAAHRLLDPASPLGFNARPSSSSHDANDVDSNTHVQPFSVSQDEFHTPPQRPRFPLLNDDPMDFHTPSRPMSPVQDGLLLSPLTPLRPSPKANALATPPQERFFSPSQPAPPPPPPPAPTPPPAIPPETRYSLRQRQAKQLHPYAYDKKVYKRQMRGNPEAIVKLRSPGGTERVREGPPGEGETQDPDYEEPPEPVPRPRRERAAGGEEEEDDSWLKQYEHLLEGGERPRKRQKTDHPHPLTHARVRKNPRPYPLELPAREKRASTPQGRATTPQQEDEDEEDEEPFTLRRHSSSATRVVLSPPAFNEFFDDAPPRRSTSPIIVPSSPSPTAMDVDPEPGGPSSPTAAEEEPDEEEDEEDDDEPELTEHELRKLRKMRKARKALKRMLPFDPDELEAAEGDKENRRVRPAAKRPRSPSGEPVPQPGRGVTRIVSGATAGPLDFRGDPESSEEEDEDESDGDSDDGVGGAGRARNPPRDEGGDNDVIEISDDDSEAVEVRPARHLGGGGRIRDGDMIDRMLSRTRVGGRSKSRRRSAGGTRTSGTGAGRTGGGGGGGGGGGSGRGLSVVTAEGKRARLKQSKLDFSKASVRDAGSDSDGERGRPRQQLQVTTRNGKLSQGQQTTLGGGNGKKKKNRPQPGVYIVHGNRQPSPVVRHRRKRRHVLQVDEEEELLDALAPSSNPVRAPSVAKPKLKPKPAPKQPIHKHAASATKNPLVMPLENVSPPRRLDDDEDGRLRRLRRGGSPQHEHTILRSELTLDFDIPCMPLGIKFAETTYIGSSRLAELCAFLSDSPPPQVPPGMCCFREIQVGPTLSFDAFCQMLPSTLDKVHDWIVAVAHGDLSGDSADAQVVYNFIAHYFSCCPRPEALYAALAEQVSSFTARVEDTLGEETTPQLLGALWFGVEIMLRVCFLPALRRDPNHIAANIEQVRLHMALLMNRLFAHGLESTIRPIQTATEALQAADSVETATQLLRARDLDERALECWVCLIHVVEKLSRASDCPLGSQKSFWDVLRGPLEDAANAISSQLRASEFMWRTIFSICAIAQFTDNGFSSTETRIGSGWQSVIDALKRIRLSADDANKTHAAAVLKTRDKIVRLVACRCFVLCTKWKWRLHDAHALFNELTRIFRSRKYGNLLGEVSDFPDFINKHDVRLLDEHKFKRDTAFAIYLKLIVLAGKHLEEAHKDDKSIAMTKLRRILSLAVPVSATGFTKASPPTGQQISMLFNRLSVVSVALLVEPHAENARSRVDRAKSYVDFKTADLGSRKAVIRASMHLVIMHRHLGLPVEHVMEWLKEITRVLLDEWKALELAPKAKSGSSSGVAQVNAERAQVALCVQLLLGAVRTIIRTPTMDPLRKDDRTFPDPAFLDGPWISDVLSSSLKDDPTTCEEIRKCVQAFLDMRRDHMPKPRRPALPADDEDSQENFLDDLDYTDPRVLVTMREPITPQQEKVLTLDERVGSIVHSTIIPSITNLICTHYGRDDTKDGDLPDDDEQHHVTLDWVDCWVECIHAAVRNDKGNPWSWWIGGMHTWAHIIDSLWRHQVHKRFMYVLLKLDPMTYKDAGDHFVCAFIQALVCVRVSWEHEFASLLFSIDGLRHPLLRDLSVSRASPEDDFIVDRKELSTKRLDFLQAIMAKISEIATAAAEPGADHVLKKQGNQYVFAIAEMLHALRDLENGREGKAIGIQYAEFCRGVRQAVKSHEVLAKNGRIAEAIGI